MMFEYVVLNQLPTDEPKATLTKWLKQEGDWVKQGEPVAEVETDKVAFDVIAESPGMLRKKLLYEGDEVANGTKLAIIDLWFGLSWERYSDIKLTPLLQPDKEDTPSEPLAQESPIQASSNPGSLAGQSGPVRKDLFHLLIIGFSNLELDDLCFELEIEYEDLPAEKRAKAREMIRYLERRDRLKDLIVAGRKLRPNLPWPEV
jgi:2-oxoglutarate dehydrogenase E2 component (dihydrolipoamide succinyltransferase)